MHISKFFLQKLQHNVHSGEYASSGGDTTTGQYSEIYNFLKKKGCVKLDWDSRSMFFSNKNLWMFMYNLGNTNLKII